MPSVKEISTEMGGGRRGRSRRTSKEQNQEVYLSIIEFFSNVLKIT